MTALTELTDSLALSARQNELIMARTALGAVLSHIEQAYAMGKHLPVTPADQLAVACAHQNIRDALAHLTAPGSADCQSAVSPIGNRLPALDTADFYAAEH